MKKGKTRLGERNKTTEKEKKKNRKTRTRTERDWGNTVGEEERFRMWWD